ncbi:MAG: tetratricopeptide repeat protein [Bacteroidales bacterium]|nr:tetratricopeptide repeat protein [Bacteroidales bacterium]
MHHISYRPLMRLSWPVIMSLVLLTAVSCHSAKQAASTSSKLTRPPIVEVSQRQLSEEGLLIEAKMQEEAGNKKKAMELLSRLADSALYPAVAHYEMARILAASYELDSAMVHAEKAVKGDGSNVWYRKLAANLYKATRQPRKEIEMWEAIVKMNPDVLENYYELSNSYIDANDIEGAIKVLNRVESMIGVTEPISLQKKKLWEHAGDNKKALREMEALAAALPNNKKYNSLVAESYMQAGNYAKAKQCYDRILASDPNDEYVHLSLAQYYKETHKPDQAFNELMIGLRNPKLDDNTRINLLASFYGDDFFGTSSKYAYPLLDSIMAHSVDSLSYAALYGEVLMRREQYAAAAHQFQLALLHDSSRYELWESLLVCESDDLSNPQAVLHDAERALALFPLRQLPYFMKGLTHYRMQNYRQAINALKGCERLGFKKGYLEADTYELVAECYRQIDSLDITFSYYDKLLALRPNDAGTLNNYAYFLAEADLELDKAETMARRAVELQPSEATVLDTYAWVLFKRGKTDEARHYMRQALDNDKTNSATLREHWEKINQ